MKSYLKKLNKKVLVGAKLEATSVQSIIIGSVISGVIASAGIAMLWPAVDSAKVVSERTTISEIQSAVAGAKSSNNSSLTIIDANVKTLITDRIASIGQDLDYYVASNYDTNTSNGAFFMVAVADFEDNAKVSKLKSLVQELDKKIDGGDGESAGKFIYDATCSSATDCYYATYLLNNGLSASSTWLNDNSLDNTLPVADSEHSDVAFELGVADNDTSSDTDKFTWARINE